MTVLAHRREPLRQHRADQKAAERRIVRANLQARIAELRLEIEALDEEDAKDAEDAKADEGVSCDKKVEGDTDAIVDMEDADPEPPTIRRPIWRLRQLEAAIGHRLPILGFMLDVPSRPVRFFVAVSAREMPNASKASTPCEPPCHAPATNCDPCAAVCHSNKQRAEGRSQRASFNLKGVKGVKKSASRDSLQLGEQLHERIVRNRISRLVAFQQAYSRLS